MFDYFGGVPNPLGFHEYPEEEEDYAADDPFADFKRKAVLVTILTTDNAFATTEDYAEDRGSMLTETEKRIYVEARWDEESSAEPFLDDMTKWDACEDRAIPALGPSDPVIGAVDGAYSARGDVFGLVLAGPHPVREGVVSIRYNKMWAAKGVARDFDLIEDDLKETCLNFAVQELQYDPRELHQMMGNLRRPSKTKSGRDFPGILCVEFAQTAQREVADKAYLDRIISRRMTHDGDPSLRLHVKNSNRKTTDDGKRLRIVRRSKSQKIDLNVCASMAAFRAEEARLPTPPQGSHSVSIFQ
jgi:phage terminase large subunit-like protein